LSQRRPVPAQQPQQAQAQDERDEQLLSFHNSSFCSTAIVMRSAKGLTALSYIF
jgi:hypothetical protein